MTQATRQLLSRPERQARILEGAASAFVARGYAGTSMEEVAAASGITKLIVYRHFSSKTALYREVLDGTYRELVNAFASARKQPNCSPGITAVLSVARSQPDAFRLFLVHAPREPEFAEYVASIRGRAVNALLSSRRDSGDATFVRWSTEVAVSYAFESVLHWLEIGSPRRDDEFLVRCSAGLRAMNEALRHDGVTPTAPR